MMTIDHYLENYVASRAILIFANTGADDFAQALPGYQPRELMPRARSLLIFGAPFIDHPRTVDEKNHLANESWWLENLPVFDQILMWRGEIINNLDNFGYGTANYGGFWLTTEPTFSYRLAMERASLGDYGRFGICIHPEYGCYFRVGVLLTDAELTPTPTQDLSDFNPCDGCSLCAEVCPVQAIDKTEPPESGYNRELCMRFILTIKKGIKKKRMSSPSA